MNILHTLYFWDGKKIKPSEPVLVLWCMFVACFFLSVANYASAHAADNTVVTIATKNTNTVTIDITAPLAVFNIALGRALTNEFIPDDFDDYLTSRIALRSEGQLWGIQLKDIQVDAHDLYVTLDAQAPPAVSADHAILEYQFLIDQVQTHQALVYDADENQNAAFLGTLRYNAVLGEINTLPVFIHEAPSVVHGWWQSVHLGFDHFRHGYDHMLFLLTILLVAPFAVVGRIWKSIPKLRQVGIRLLFLSLAFTCGHSIALLYGSFHNVLPYKDLIEFFIAVTITVSALHAWRPMFGKVDLLIVGMFGVIHGLAFASELSLVDISLWARVTSVFGFNMGLESFQLLTLLILLPIYILLLHKSNPTKSRQLLALVAILVSSYWMVERLWLLLAL